MSWPEVEAGEVEATVIAYADTPSAATRIAVGASFTLATTEAFHTNEPIGTVPDGRLVVEEELGEDVELVDATATVIARRATVAAATLPILTHLLIGRGLWDLKLSVAGLGRASSKSCSGIARIFLRSSRQSPGGPTAA